MSVGCSRPESAADAAAGVTASDAAVAEALSVADEYVEGYYEQFPEAAYEFGYAGPMDRLGDRSPEAMRQWRDREDAWLDRLESIDSAALEGTRAAVPWAFARERLRASIALRVCRDELWNVSPTWTGWQNQFPGVFAKQPVGSAASRADVLARARDIPRYLETEVANLRLGIREGYTAPRSNVHAVIRQLDALLSVEPAATPYFEPAARDGALAFSAELESVIGEEIQPATRRYRDFLASEYLPAARESVGVSSDPGGRDCYSAAVNFHASLPLTPQEIHRTGLREMERIHAEMREIGIRSFGTEDVSTLLATARENPGYAFETREGVIAFAQAAVDRARDSVRGWFGTVPEAEVILKPYPDYMQVTGGGFYSAGAADGSTPGTYEFGAYEPRTLSRASGFEATTFHETYPGHHMQAYVAIEGAALHPILKYFYVSGMGEGWALYTERLADEMGLYTADVDRLGMLSNEAFRAARLVVDPGLHALGWTRQQAIDYMLANTAALEAETASEIDRYIAVPGQATAYLTGSLWIQELRREAENALGDRFDIREFHDRVIEDGTVTLTMLAEKLRRWIGEVPRD
jgi:uncharacterized protein (DUF885 family)